MAASSSTTTLMPSKTQVLHLFRSLLRASSKFSDYNIREYVRRRTIDGFRENRRISDEAAAAAAFAAGQSQLEIARRQAVVYSLYAPKVKSIMEINN